MSLVNLKKKNCVRNHRFCIVLGLASFFFLFSNKLKKNILILLRTLLILVITEVHGSMRYVHPPPSVVQLCGQEGAQVSATLHVNVHERTKSKMIVASVKPTLSKGIRPLKNSVMPLDAGRVARSAQVRVYYCSV